MMEPVNDINKKLKSVELILENLESVLIEIRNIGILTIPGIKNPIYSSEWEPNETVNEDEFFITIRAMENLYESYSDSCSQIPGKWFSDENNPRLLPFDRLIKYNDIAAVELLYNDGSAKYIYVNWPADLHEYNPFQSAMIDKIGGDLHILISPIYTIKTYLKVQS